jgi:hypothetical protein
MSFRSIRTESRTSDSMAVYSWVLFGPRLVLYPSQGIGKQSLTTA